MMEIKPNEDIMDHLIVDSGVKSEIDDCMAVQWKPSKWYAIPLILSKTRSENVHVHARTRVENI